jgi:hypothetical protein
MAATDENRSAGRSIDDLLNLNDVEFIEAAYQTILLRPMDVDGLDTYLARLHDGEPRTNILAALMNSDEAKAKSPQLPWSPEELRSYAASRRTAWERWPFRAISPGEGARELRWARREIQAAQKKLHSGKENSRILAERIANAELAIDERLVPKEMLYQLANDFAQWRDALRMELSALQEGTAGKAQLEQLVSRLAIEQQALVRAVDSLQSTVDSLKTELATCAQRQRAQSANVLPPEKIEVPLSAREAAIVQHFKSLAAAQQANR